jgi:hypothetical protein
MNHEFILIFDLYDEGPPKEGSTEPEWLLIRTNCRKKWLADLNNITDCRELISKSGRVIKNRCEVYNKYENRWLTVKESYNRTKDILTMNEKRTKVKGFNNE